LAFDFQADLSRYLDSPDFHIKTRLQTTVSRHDSDGLVWRLWGVGGSRGYKVRCYDKRQEAQAVVGKEYWHGVWAAQGFSLEAPIWRIEYEMHRDFLKEWKINRLSEFLNAQLSIQKRLFDLWSIGIADERVKSGKADRMQHVPEFEYLIEHFSQPFLEHEVDRRPESYERAASQQLVRAVNSLVSMMTNSAAAMYSKTNDPKDIVVYISKSFRAFQEKLNETILGDPRAFLLAVTALLQKKGFYYTSAHEKLEVPA
jgi:hypothetical protein